MPNILSFSRGAQFRDGKSAPLAVVLIILIIAIIGTYSTNEIWLNVMLITMFIVVFFIMLDFQGVQVNKDQNLIRVYKLNIWGKTGSWRSFENFIAVSIRYDSYRVKEIDLAHSSGNTLQGTHSAVYGQFLVSLINIYQEEVLITSCLTYNDAKREAKIASEKLGFIIIDKFQESIIHAKKTRRR